ncbi:hypothetical protein A1507_11835 [Methylomonas koyamae]|uniref:Uncharacterized protein n=1 Tax=Methylomonas koyamae TaxID=702114 RepID=A0A177NFL9_9GAMM|nr:hypothetical protein A1507_11835 [Methylomonas koyamae]
MASGINYFPAERRAGFRRDKVFARQPLKFGAEATTLPSLECYSLNLNLLCYRSDEEIIMPMNSMDAILRTIADQDAQIKALKQQIAALESVLEN